MSAMRRSPRWTAMAPPSYTVRPLQREKAQDGVLLGLEPVGERLEAALLDAYPEPLLLGLEGIRGFESGILPPLTIGPGHETQKQGFWVRIEQGRFKPLTDWLKSE